MNEQDERAETCRNCLLFEPGSSLCTMRGFPVDPDEFVCGEFLDKQEFREEML